MAKIFDDGDELWSAVEEAFGRHLSVGERAMVDPSNSYGLPTTFDEHEFAELLILVRGRFTKASPIGPERWRIQAHRHAERTAQEARPFVEQIRERLFGSREPKFDSGEDAATWIESLVGERETTVLDLSVQVTDSPNDLQLLINLQSWLENQLQAWRVRGGSGNEPTFGDISRNAPEVRKIGTSSEDIQYYTSDPEMPIRWASAPSRSVLGDLRVEAAVLSSATHWTEAAAVHHILTGGITYPVRGVKVRAEHRAGLNQFGGPMLLIEILDPERTSVEQVRSAYIDARRDLSLSTGRNRARLLISGELLVPFVNARRPAMAWAQVLKEWNDLDNDPLFPNGNAMRVAYQRAHG